MPRSVLLFALVLAPLLGRAQPTNAELVARLAADCLADVPPGTAFRLDAPNLPAYLRRALVTRWQDAGFEPFDSTGPATLPVLRLAPETVGVTYVRAGRRHFDRTATVRIAYTTLPLEGRLGLDAVCDTSLTDRITRRDVQRLDADGLAGTPPASSWWTRTAEPIVVAGAVVVSTLLLFTVRSR